MINETRLSTSINPLDTTEDDALDTEEENAFFDYAEGTEARDKLIADLSLTHSAEEVRTLMANIDKLIADTSDMNSSMFEDEGIQ